MGVASEFGVLGKGTACRKDENLGNGATLARYEPQSQTKQGASYAGRPRAPPCVLKIQKP